MPRKIIKPNGATIRRKLTKLDRAVALLLSDQTVPDAVKDSLRDWGLQSEVAQAARERQDAKRERHEPVDVTVWIVDRRQRGVGAQEIGR